MLKIESLNFDVLFPQTVFNNKNVKVVHFNNPNNKRQMYVDMYPFDKGTPCAVGIINHDGTVINIGVSYCNAQDNYNKKLARNIAYARARFTNSNTYTITQILNNFIKNFSIQPIYENSLLMDVIRNRKNELTFYDLSLVTVLNYAFYDCGTLITNKWCNQPYLDEGIFTTYKNLIKNDNTTSVNYNAITEQLKGYSDYVKPKGILQKCKDKCINVVESVLDTKRM